MHLVHAFTLSPDNKRVHCKLGFCFLLMVGLYFPRSFTKRHAMLLDFWQIAHFFVMQKVYHF